ERLGITLTKVADGRVHERGFIERKPPRKGKKNIYLITSAQNNTRLHQGWNNILAYKDWLESLPDVDHVELMVSRFTYNVSSYGPKSVKPGRAKSDEDVWYAPEIAPYVMDDNVLIAQGLVVAGRQNILPTRKFPLSNKAELHGRLSNIIP